MEGHVYKIIMMNIHMHITDNDNGDDRFKHVIPLIMVATYSLVIRNMYLVLHASMEIIIWFLKISKDMAK